MSDNNDWFDDFMDFKMSSSSSSPSSSSGHSSSSTRIPAWVYVLGIIALIIKLLES